MKPDDVVIDFENKRWVVITVNPTQKGYYTLAQNCQIRLMSKNDVIYKFEIPDLKLQ